MSDSASNAFSHPIRVADLAARKPTRFSLAPAANLLPGIAAELGIDGLRKLSFKGELRPIGRRDFVLEATLGATVTQACIVTLAPVTTRIDEPVRRTYLAEMPEPSETEVEMPEDDSVDPLPDVIDLGAVMLEALALALPLYPRADGAEMGSAVYTQPGQAPMKDDDTKPFAGLGALRDKILKGSDEAE